MMHVIPCLTFSQILHPSQRLPSPVSAQFITIPVFWAKEDLRFMIELEHNPLHVAWASMTATHLNGPCFYSGPANTASYTEVLEAWFIPQLRDVWLWHNGAPAHSTLTCNIFDKHFAGCWIGCQLPAVQCMLPSTWCTVTLARC